MTTKVPYDLVQVEIATFSIQFLLPIGSADTFTILQSAPFGFTIDKAFYQTATGAITADVRIEGASVTDLDALSITTTEGNTTASGSPLTQVVTAGDKITVVTSGGSPAAATMVSLCLECTKTEI